MLQAASNDALQLTPFARRDRSEQRDEMLRILKEVHAETLAMNAQQESLKRQLRDITIRLKAMKRKLYNLTSGYIDAAMTAVEKSSPAAKIIRRLRSRIRRPDLDEQATVEPAPEKAA